MGPAQIAALENCGIEVQDFNGDIKFREFEIFSALEPQLVNDILLYAQSKYILEQNNDVLFIFKGLSFPLFTIKLLSAELDFTNESLTIDKITDGKINHISPNFKINTSVFQKIKFLNRYTWKLGSYC